MGKVVELYTQKDPGFYVPSLNKELTKDASIFVEESTLYDNLELHALLTVDLIKIKASTKVNPVELRAKVLGMGKSQNKEDNLGVEVPDNFEDLHWKQQAKILNKIQSVDFFKIIRGVAKEGFFKEYANKRIAELKKGK